MKWIEQEIARAIKDGADEITWTTPSGFNVRQRLMKYKSTIIQTQLMGRCEIHLAGAETFLVEQYETFLIQSVK